MGSEGVRRGIHVRPVVSTSSGDGASVLKDPAIKRICSSTAVKSSGDVAERNCGGGDKFKFSRFLQSAVSGAETKREMASNFGFEPFKQIFRNEGEFQDGDSGIHSGGASSRGVVNFHRLHGRIFSCANSSVLSEVPTVCYGGQSFSVPLPGNGTVFFTKGFHKSSESSEGICTEVRGKVESVPRRLDCAWQLKRNGREADSVGSSSVSKAGLDYQSGEVRVGAKTRDSVSGMPVRFREVCVKDYGSQVDEASGVDSAVSRAGEATSEAVASAVGAVGVVGENGALGSVAHETNTVVSGRSVVTKEGLPTEVSVGVRGSKDSFTLVDKPTKCVDGNAYQEKYTRGRSVHGQLVSGLGGTQSGEQGIVDSEGGLDRTGEDFTHKCVGVDSYSQGVESMGRRLSREGCVCGVRQQISCELHPETRRHSIGVVVRSCSATPDVVRGEENSAPVSTHSRQAECVGGRSLSTRSDCGYGMVSASAGSSGSVGGVGSSSHRLVRDPVQQETGGVCVAIPGSRSVCGGCAFFRLEGDPGICVSTNSNHPQGVDESEGRGLCSDSRCPMLGEAVVVSGHVGSASGSAVTDTVCEEAAEAASIGRVSQSTPSVESSRVEVVEQALLKKGFSDKVASRMARAQKNSSGEVYNGKWRVFSDWCKGRGADPCQASVVMVADFLLFLHEVKKLAVSTIEGYRTALNSVFKAVQGVDLGKEALLSDLISNFERDTNSIKEPLCPWNLALVLQVLSSAPFEPLGLAPLNLVTFKTVFLVTLASGKRRSEIHAILKDSVSFQERGNLVLLGVDPKFLAKTQTIDGVMLSPIVIKSLASFLSKDMEEDRRLCPVRALKFYLDRTKDLRWDKKKLFVSFKKGFKGDIAKGTISGWIKKTVLKAYEIAGKKEELLRLHRVKAHDVRALAASWACARMASMESILSAGQWKSHTTFTQFYLRDLTFCRNQMLELGPLSVASQIV